MSCDLIPATIGGGLVVIVVLAIVHLCLRIGELQERRRERRARWSR